MKPIVIVSSLVIGTLLGLYGGFKKEKPKWWKYTVVLLVIVASALTLIPHIAGDLDDVKQISKFIPNKQVPTHLIFLSNSKTQENGRDFLAAYSPERPQFTTKIAFNGGIPAELLNGGNFVASITYDTTRKEFAYNSILRANPWITYPYVFALEDRVKILPFHVPMAWLAVLAYLVAMIYSIKFLKTNDKYNDIVTVSSALLGTVFAILATTTGMIWAKFNWGSFWNWDPRETSIFILLIIYFAYFALRSSIEKEDLRAKISSVYAILAFVTVPFLVFVLPRTTGGLHPGAQGDGGSGPILSSNTGMLNSSLLFGFGMCMLAFTVLYFWLLNIQVRLNTIKNKIGE